MFDLSQDPRALRRQLSEMIHVSWLRPQQSGHGWMAVEAVVHNCESAARHHGLSGEDKMTLLACAALNAYAAQTERVMELASVMPSSGLVSPASPPTPTPEG